MHTVAGMLKRFLTVATGVALGVALTVLAGRVAPAWSLFPNRSLERSANYYHDVLKLVNENYVDSQKADPAQLTQAAFRGMIGSLDPHSEFLEAKDYSDLEDEMN
ncbi:MAG TPA: S41 family peptidase, partial [Opitutaceae bacterium]|nr:S41 family peptidase [Opitutaceae bacterium]